MIITSHVAAVLLSSCSGLDPRQDNEVYRILSDRRPYLKISLADLFGPSWDTMCFVGPGSDPHRYIPEMAGSRGHLIHSLPKVDEFLEHIWKLVLLSGESDIRIVELQIGDFEFISGYQKCYKAEFLEFEFTQKDWARPRPPELINYYKVKIIESNKTN